MFACIISPAEKIIAGTFFAGTYFCRSWKKPQKSQELEPAKVSCNATVGTEEEIFADLDLCRINTIKIICMSSINH